MQEGQNGCKKNNTRADEERQITVARTNQQEGEEEDSGMKPVGRENKIEQPEEKRGKKTKTKQASIRTSKYVPLLPFSR